MQRTAKLKAPRKKGRRRVAKKARNPEASSNNAYLCVGRVHVRTCD